MATSGNGNRTNALNQNAANNSTATTTGAFLNPAYQTLAEGTTGYTPQQKTNMQTAISQGTGGGVASAVGQGGLLAARTGNAGGADAAIDDAAQAAGRTQAAAGLQVNTQDANLAQKNREVGLEGLNSIYNTSTGAAVGDLNAANNAGNSFWKQLLLQGLKTGGEVGAAAVGA